MTQSYGVVLFGTPCIVFKIPIQALQLPSLTLFILGVFPGITPRKAFEYLSDPAPPQGIHVCFVIIPLVIVVIIIVMFVVPLLSILCLMLKTAITSVNVPKIKNAAKTHASIPGFLHERVGNVYKCITVTYWVSQKKCTQAYWVTFKNSMT